MTPQQQQALWALWEQRWAADSSLAPEQFLTAINAKTRLRPKPQPRIWATYRTLTAILTATEAATNPGNPTPALAALAKVEAIEAYLQTQPGLRKVHTWLNETAKSDAELYVGMDLGDPSVVPVVYALRQNVKDAQDQTILTDADLAGILAYGHDLVSEAEVAGWGVVTMLDWAAASPRGQKIETWLAQQEQAKQNAINAAIAAWNDQATVAQSLRDDPNAPLPPEIDAVSV